MILRKNASFYSAVLVEARESKKILNRFHVVLWPLFHYLVWTNDNDGRSEKQYWEDYVAVNRQFAEVIAAQYRPGDVSK